jgi:two-component system, chemotaxis family, protein-glutamate methylesterase/glutaminase
LMAHEPTIPPRRLLIVDDSPLMRRALQSIFSTDTRFQIVGSAENGVEALQLVDQLEPDVVTMDLQMPLMDGLTALKHIMVRRPLPVVVLSAFTGQTSPLTYQAFKYGAVDVLAKPAAKGNGSGMTEHANDIRARVLQACSVRMEAARVIRRNKRDHAPSESQMGGSGGPAAGGQQTRKLVALICGAGGFPLLLKFTGALSGSWSLPPILACIAFPTKVIEALLPNLQEDSERDIELLRSDISLKPGVIYLQSHETCCKLSSEGPNIWVTGNPTWPDSRRPFDACLTSAAETFGDDLLALVLSGTGDDGVEGMRQVRRDGGLAYALAPEACLNPELPKKILDLGLATGVGSITELLSLLGGLLSEGRRRCAV